MDLEKLISLDKQKKFINKLMEDNRAAEKELNKKSMELSYEYLSLMEVWTTIMKDIDLEQRKKDENI